MILFITIRENDLELSIAKIAFEFRIFYFRFENRNRKAVLSM